MALYLSFGMEYYMASVCVNAFGSGRVSLLNPLMSLLLNAGNYFADGQSHNQ